MGSVIYDIIGSVFVINCTICVSQEERKGVSSSEVGGPSVARSVVLLRLLRFMANINRDRAQFGNISTRATMGFTARPRAQQEDTLGGP